MTVWLFRRWPDVVSPRHAVQYVRLWHRQLRRVRPRRLVVQWLSVVQPQRAVGQQRASVPGNQLVAVGVRYADICHEDASCRLVLQDWLHLLQQLTSLDDGKAAEVSGGLLCRVGSQLFTEFPGRLGHIVHTILKIVRFFFWLRKILRVKGKSGHQNHCSVQVHKIWLPIWWNKDLYNVQSCFRSSRPN